VAISGQQLVDWILQNMLGVPYQWGGTSRSGVDCSGLMYLAFQHFGISIPRVTYDQINAGRIVKNIQSAQPGDLIFFDSDHNGTPSHVGMYMGNNQIVVADTTGTPVRIRSLAQEDRIVGITRMPGVISTNNDFGSLAGFNNLLSMNGSNGTAALPVARPSFDWWSAMGLNSSNMNQANQNVGLIKAFIMNDPELENLYSEAVAGNYSQDQFVAALQKTNWWANNSDVVRKNLATKATDPATWNKTVADMRAEIQDMAAKLGVPLTSSSLDNVTSTAAMFGYNQSQIQAMLGHYLQDIQGGFFGGYAGQVQLAIKEYAADMGIPLSNTFVNQNTDAIVAGTSSLNDIRAQIATQAALAFPAFADLINKGVTVGEIAMPYATTLSSVLEQNPNTIDLFNPILRQAMQYKDPKTGAPAVKQVYDFETDLRKNPLWLKTNNAREGMLGAAGAVLTDMGLASPTLGAAPQTSPDAPTAVSAGVAATSGGLSGQTVFPTLQGQQALATPKSPTGGGDAASLAPDTSFTTQGTPQMQ
jgi:hypothetical protein